jgi:hypothetical protein
MGEHVADVVDELRQHLQRKQKFMREAVLSEAISRTQANRPQYVASILPPQYSLWQEARRQNARFKAQIKQRIVHLPQNTMDVATVLLMPPQPKNVQQKLKSTYHQLISAGYQFRAHMTENDIEIKVVNSQRNASAPTCLDDLWRLIQKALKPLESGSYLQTPEGLVLQNLPVAKVVQARHLLTELNLLESKVHLSARR